MSIWVLLLILVYAIACAVLILGILLQSGKGGGLSSLGSGAGGALSDSLGATGAEKTLVKFTTWVMTFFFILSLGLTILGARTARTGGLKIDNLPSSAPTAPASAPASTEGPDDAAPASAPASGEKAPAASAPAAPEATEKP